MSIRESKEIKKLSVAGWYDPFVSILIVISAYLALFRSPLTNVELVLVITFITTVYMFAIELWRRDWSVKIERVRTTREIVSNIFTKYLGIIFGIMLILFCYWLIPEYQNARYLGSLNEAKYIFLIFFLPISLLLVTVTEYVLGPKRDGTFQFGLLMQLKLTKVDWIAFKDGCFEWLVRLIFLTLNFTSSVNIVGNLRVNGFDFWNSSFAGAVLSLESLIFVIILLVILPGYVFSSRLINTDVRAVDTSWFGWTTLLICYQPFITPIFGNILDYTPSLAIYNGSPIWVGLTLGFPILLYIVGIFIIFFALIHLWGEAIIGIRSSNLTNRGIITNGPFRFTKHPVYVAKCFGWALIAMPFINSVTFLDSFRLGLLFLGVCGIYIARSLVEERVLSTDPDYVKYALFMDKHGAFAFVGKFFPIMTFEWRQKYWKRHQS